MEGLSITPYTTSDDAEALDLEGRCIQGKSLAVRFIRPSFDARSKVYYDYRILCARRDGKLVGTVAAAIKPVRMHGGWISAAYLYDLRVDRAVRGKGIGRRLAQAIQVEVQPGADMLYVLVAGQNRPALNLVGTTETPQRAFPLTYTCLAVYGRPEGEAYQVQSPAALHELYLKHRNGLEFVPEFQPDLMLGHVQSIVLRDMPDCGCSIWTNEDLMAEEIVRLPFHLRVAGTACRIASKFVGIPHLPKTAERVDSWFLYDVSAPDEKCLQRLLATVKHLAREARRNVIYLLLQNGDPLLDGLKKSRGFQYSFPYRLIAGGRHMPGCDDRVYLDVRDL